MKTGSILLLVSVLTFYGTKVNAQKDFTSKVPQYIFGKTLDEQKTQLKNNPLMLRFEQSRKDQSVNIHRPVYHFISPEGALNDPNGLCYWNGNWHMFYQAYPPDDPRQHWGHAISKDLVFWKDLPYAIYPNPEEKVFSGSTLVEKDRVIAMYYGVGQGVMVAVSDDPLLLNWKKLTGKPVISVPKPGQKLPYNVFDPNIWKKGDYYYTILAGTLPEGPGKRRVRAHFLFRSPDLINWGYMHQFVENDNYSLVGDDGACPYFWPIGNKGKYMLLYFSHKSGAKYLIGDYDIARDKFEVTDGGNFNHGPVSFGGVHAPSAYPDGKGNIVAIFNMKSGKAVGPGDYTEIMTLPRLLTLDDENKLVMKPLDAMGGLRTNHKIIKDLLLPANREVVVEGVNGKAMEMNFTIDMKKAKHLEIDVLQSPNKEEYTRILFYKDGGYPNRELPGEKGRKSAFAIDNSRSSLDGKIQPRIPELTGVEIKPGEKLNIRIFIDHSVVEVFVNDRQCLSLRAFPTLKESNGVSVRAHGEEALISELNVWEMKKSML